MSYTVKIKKIFTIGLYLLMLLSCRKEKLAPIAPLNFDIDNLPKIATNGQDYYGFLLDGLPIWGQNDGSAQEKIFCRYVESDTSFYLELSAEENSSLLININSVLQVGKTYVLKDYQGQDSSKASATYYRYEKMYKGIFLYPAINNEPGFLKILQINKKKRTLSGIFELKVKYEWRPKIISITKGRFDVTYSPYPPFML